MQSPLPFHLLAKPTGATCNLDCKYCFFLSKDGLYSGGSLRMADEVLETYIRQLLAAQPNSEVNIAWQGGEPTLMGLPFFKRAVVLAQKYRMPGQSILHTIQTNGVLLTDDWARFLKEHGFLVGLSVDGPREMHDAYRVAKGGQGTFDQVMRAWDCLSRHQVETNVLCCVHAANGDSGLAVYRFFRDVMRARYLQFIPVVERVTRETLDQANRGWSERAGDPHPLYLQQGDLVTDRSVRPDQYGRFLCAIFDEWIRRDVGQVFIQTSMLRSPTRSGAPAPASSLQHAAMLSLSSTTAIFTHAITMSSRTTCWATLVKRRCQSSSHRRSSVNLAGTSSNRCRSNVVSARCCSPVTESVRAIGSPKRVTASSA
jgi:uncharacterized protein